MLCLFVSGCFGSSFGGDNLPPEIKKYQHYKPILRITVPNFESSAGIIAGTNNGTVKNVTIEAAITELKSMNTGFFHNAGIISGQSNGLIESSIIKSGSITMVDNSEDRTIAGGIAGSSVKGSYAAGQITADDYAGGIAGVVEQGAAEVSASVFIG